MSTAGLEAAIGLIQVVMRHHGGFLVTTPSARVMLSLYGRPSGTLTEPDAFGDYLGLAFVVGIGYEKRLRNLVGVGGAWLYLAVVALCVLLTGSRLPIGGVVLTLLVATFLPAFRKRIAIGRLWFGFGLATAVLVLTVHRVASRLAVFFSLATTVGSANSGVYRLETMAFMFERLRSIWSWIVGLGFGTLKGVTEPLRNIPGFLGTLYGWGSYGPSLVVNITFDVGIIGLVLWVVSQVTILRRVDLEIPQALPAWLGLVFILGVSMGGDLSATVYPWLCWAVLLGLQSARSRAVGVRKSP